MAAMLAHVTNASATPGDIRIPEALKPSDGRFGSGPSKVRPEQVAALAATGSDYLGTSHRQAPVRAVVGRLRSGLRDLFSLPDGYEVVLGNGGTTCFWDIATFCLIERRSQHLSFGEFSSKFAAAAKAAPHLEDPQVIESAAGTHPEATAVGDVDLYALTHNETSTGVAMEIRRPAGAGARARSSPWTARRRRAGSGSTRANSTPTTSPLRSASPPTVGCGWRCSRPVRSTGWHTIAERRALGPGLPRPHHRHRQLHQGPDLQHAGSRHAAALRRAGRVDARRRAASSGRPGRCDRSAEILYTWAEQSDFAMPFVGKPSERSHVVGTVDFVDAVDAAAVARVLRANGIVDTEPYRKLGRNQLRIAMFPAIDPEDVAALCACINYVVGALAS